MSFDPYGSFLNFSAQGWSLDDDDLLRQKEESQVEESPVRNNRKSSPDLLISVEGEPNTEEIRPARDLGGSTLKRSKSSHSEPETSVTAALTEPNDSFSFEINLPPGADVSPLSCKESVIAMMLSRSVDRALESPPPFREIRTSSPAKRDRTRSRSWSRGNSQNHTSRRKDRRGSVGDITSSGPSEASSEQKTRRRSHSMERREQHRSSSKERTSGDGRSSSKERRSVRGSRPRSKSTDPSAYRNSSRDVSERKGRRSRSKSSVRNSEGDRDRMSTSKQRVDVMEEIREDTGNQVPKKQRSPSRSRRRSKSTAGQRSSSRAPSQGPKRGSGSSSSRARSQSRTREQKRYSEKLSDVRPLSPLNESHLARIHKAIGLHILEEERTISARRSKYRRSLDSNNKSPREKSSRRHRESTGKSNGNGERSSKWDELRRLKNNKQDDGQMEGKGSASKWTSLKSSGSFEGETRKEIINDHQDQSTADKDTFSAPQHPDEKEGDGCISVKPKLQTVSTRLKSSRELSESRETESQRGYRAPLSPGPVPTPTNPSNDVHPSSKVDVTREEEGEAGAKDDAWEKAYAPSDSDATIRKHVIDKAMEQVNERRRGQEVCADETSMAFSQSSKIPVDREKKDLHTAHEAALVAPKLTPVILSLNDAPNDRIGSRNNNDSPKVHRMPIPRTSESSESSTGDRLKRVNQMIQQLKRKKEESISRRKSLDENSSASDQSFFEQSKGIGFIPSNSDAGGLSLRPPVWNALKATTIAHKDLHGPVSDANSTIYEEEKLETSSDGDLSEWLASKDENALKAATEFEGYTQGPISAEALKEDGNTPSELDFAGSEAPSKWTNLKGANQSINNTRKRAERRKGGRKHDFKQDVDVGIDSTAESSEPRRPSSSKWKDLSARMGVGKVYIRGGGNATGDTNTLDSSTVQGRTVEQSPKISPRPGSKWAGLRNARAFISNAGRQNEYRRRLSGNSED